MGNISKAAEELHVTQPTLSRQIKALWIKIPSNELNIVGSQNLLSNSLPLVKAGIGDVLCAAGSFNLRPDLDLKLIPIKTDSVIHHTLIWKQNQNFPVATKIFIDFIRKYQR